jgi:hypothetical protein
MVVQGPVFNGALIGRVFRNYANAPRTFWITLSDSGDWLNATGTKDVNNTAPVLLGGSEMPDFTSLFTSLRTLPIVTYQCGEGLNKAILIC